MTENQLSRARTMADRGAQIPDQPILGLSDENADAVRTVLVDAERYHKLRAWVLHTIWDSVNKIHTAGPLPDTQSPAFDAAVDALPEAEVRGDA